MFNVLKKTWNIFGIMEPNSENLLNISWFHEKTKRIRCLPCKIHLIVTPPEHRVESTTAVLLSQKHEI